MMSIVDVAKNDFRLVRRDLILIMLLLFVVYLGVVLRFLLPWANGYLATHGFLPNPSVAFPLSHYYPVILSFLVLYTGAILGGAIFGFLILSEKDEDTIRAMLVTPLSPKRYVDFRIAMSVVISFLFIVFIFYVVNIDVLAKHEMLVVSLAAAWTAPIVMLFLAILAEGQLQGMSYGKFLSFGGLLTAVSWWVTEPIQFLFGLFPPYWASKAYWVALDGSGMWVVYVLIALLTQVAAVFGLRYLFVRRVYRGL